MKNKELARLLCITIASAVVACSPAAIMAEGEVTEQQGEPTPEPQPTAAPDPVVTPAPQPTAAPEPTVAPEPVVTPAPEPTAAPEPQPTQAPEPTQEPEAQEPEPTQEPSEDESAESLDGQETEQGSADGETAAETELPDPAETSEQEVSPSPEPTPTPEEDSEEAKKAEEEAKTAEELVKKIEELSKKKLTVKDKDAVKAVRKKYDGLSEQAKKLVTNYKKLVLLEKTIEKLEKEETLAKVGDPVIYKDTASIHHAGKEFYLKNLQNIYHLSFSDDIQKVLDEITNEYLEECGIDAESTEPALIRVRNWQDILAVYVYQQSQDGKDTFTVDRNAKDSLKEIFAEMNPVVYNPQDKNQAALANCHIGEYIKSHQVSADGQQILNKYLESDCRLLCATVTAYSGFVRSSVGEGVSEERVQVLTAAYSAIGKVGYFWGGKYENIGYNPEWGSFRKVEAEGSRTTGMLRAYGLDCSGFVTWAVVNGYKSTGMAGAIGNGTSDQWERAGSVKIEDVQPGDLVFQDGPAAGSQNHVGIVVGKTASGDLVVIHCSAGQNGVTVGDAYGAGFRYVRKASFYPSAEETAKEFVDTSSWVLEEASLTEVESKEPEEKQLAGEETKESDENLSVEEDKKEADEIQQSEEETKQSEETQEPEKAEEIVLPAEIIEKIEVLSQPEEVLLNPEIPEAADLQSAQYEAEDEELIGLADAVQAEVVSDLESGSEDPGSDEEIPILDAEEEPREVLERAGYVPVNRTQIGQTVEKVREDGKEEEAFDGDGDLPEDILEKLLVLNQSDLLRENLLDASTASSLNQLQKYNQSDLKD